MLIMLRGLLTGISGGQTFFDLPASMLYLGHDHLARACPPRSGLCLLLFAVGICVLGFTRHGRALYAIGGNVDAARAAGIRTDRVLWIVLVGASVLAALGGLLLSRAARLRSPPTRAAARSSRVRRGRHRRGQPQRRQGHDLRRVHRCPTLQLVVNVMTLAGVPPLWNQFLNGAIIIVALVISRFASGEKQE